ncbi:hypothetical protein NE237_032693 [Protea cynaroides]|uniref:Uncharacterized protein n=1 Tax=Protea cynaroides TaxID=273540 RepID=A0A9Q0L4F9_9MAGN|nr:hypothetical protein NE237_032693 [Protea cynaroides]
MARKVVSSDEKMQQSKNLSENLVVDLARKVVQLLEPYAGHSDGWLRVGGFYMVSSSDIPVNVLDLYCSSSECDKIISFATTTVKEERDLKLRKMDFSNETTFQLSLIQQCHDTGLNF